MKAMIIKEFRELRRDRRTVAMIVGLPILLLVIFGYAANFTVSTLPTIVVGPQATTVAAALPSLFDVRSIEPGATSEDAQTYLQDAKAQVVIDTTTTPPTAWVDGADLFQAQTAVTALAKAGGAAQTKVLFNPDLTTAWYMVPSLIGLIMTFIGTIVTSIGLVRERENGTLEQLAVMPFRPVDVIVGKIAPYFLLAAVDLVLVTGLGMLLFDVPFNGSVLVFGLGAALSQNTGQAIQGAILVLLPQVLLSGMIFPLAAMPLVIRCISYCMPLTWFTMISRGTMLRATPITSPAIWLPLVVLAFMAAVIFGLAVLRFRRDLAPGRRHSRTPETVDA
jgi:ABC-2 type transport system permease protein